MTFHNVAYKIGEEIIVPSDITHISLEVDAKSGKVSIEVLDLPIRVTDNGTEISKKTYSAKIDDVELIVNVN